LQLLGGGPDRCRLLLSGGDRCAAALAALQAAPRERRAELLAAVLKEAAAPVPPAVLELDPTWMETIDEDPALMRAATALLPAAFRTEAEATLRRRGAGSSPALRPGPAALADLQRIVLAPLAALTAEPEGPLGKRLASEPQTEILFALAREGARALGQSLAGAPLSLRAQAMARVGAPLAAEMGRAASETVDEVARDRAREVVARAAALTGEMTDPGTRLRVVGALVLGPALAGEGVRSVARVAGRLPVALGRLLLEAANISLPGVF
jgi:hypothetical protein